MKSTVFFRIFLAPIPVAFVLGFFVLSCSTPPAQPGRTVQRPAGWPGSAQLVTAAGREIAESALGSRITGTWLPKTAAARPVSATTSGGAFTCAFAAANTRAVWDLPLRADLRTAAGVRFRFRASDVSGVNRFFFYFKSGSGWYGTTFSPKGNGAWEEIVAWKSDSFIEEQPAGWAQIDGVRISATPGAAKNVGFEVCDLRTVRGDPRLAVVRNTGALAGASPTDARSVADYPKRLCAGLHRSQVYPMFLDDADLRAGFPKNTAPAVIFLPYSLRPAPGTMAAVQAALENGAHVVGFFNPPPELARTLGIRVGGYVMPSTVPGGFTSMAFKPGVIPGAPARLVQNSWIIQEQQPDGSGVQIAATWSGTPYPACLLGPKGAWFSHVYLDADPDSGSRSLLALAGRWLPDLWRAAAVNAVAEIAPLNLDAPTQSRAREFRADAARRLAAGQYAAAIASADAARAAFDSALLASLPAVRGELRAAWCHRDYGIAGWSWEQSVKRLHDCGFNALYANLYWPDAASWPSRAAPAANGPDQLRACAEACRRNNVKLHVWMPCFKLQGTAKPALRGAGRLQVDFSGKTNPNWLCPSNTANRKQLVDAVREVVRNYPVAGIHLDYIRYPDAEHCVCTECRRRFEAECGSRVANWPAALKSGALHGKWLEFRRRQISSIVREIRKAMDAEKPGLTLSAAVFDSFASAPDAVGQESAAWAKAGLMDQLCPMNYVTDARQFAEMVRRQQAAIAGTKTMLCPGIGVRAVRLTPLQTAEQILETRRRGAGGFILFEFNRDEADRIFPDLAKGLTRPD